MKKTFSVLLALIFCIGQIMPLASATEGDSIETTPDGTVIQETEVEFVSITTDESEVPNPNQVDDKPIEKISQEEAAAAAGVMNMDQLWDAEGDWSDFFINEVMPAQMSALAAVQAYENGQITAAELAPVLQDEINTMLVYYQITVALLQDIQQSMAVLIAPNVSLTDEQVHDLHWMLDYVSGKMDDLYTSLTAPTNTPFFQPVMYHLVLLIQISGDDPNIELPDAWQEWYDAIQNFTGGPDGPTSIGVLFITAGEPEKLQVFIDLWEQYLQTLRDEALAEDNSTP